MPKIPFARPALAALALALIAVAGQAGFGSASTATYLVRPGDSLWAIAHRHGISVNALAAANGMRLSDLLLIGRHLVIPGTAPPGGAAAPAGGTPRSAAGAAGSANTSNFCETFTPQAAPWRRLPDGLAESPARLALRPLFVHWARYYGVSPALVEAVAWQESGWQQGVVSSANAVGIGQIIPSTAAFISSQLIGLPLSINSVSDNIRMMTRFLSYLQAVEGGRCRTIAAYYEGPVNLARYGVLPETVPYVTSVEALVPRFE